MMTLKELGHVGRMLTSFLLSFGMCFKSLAGRKLLRIYVQGQLSDLQRKNCETMALKVRVRERYSVFWNRSSGMKNVCGIGVSRSLLASILTRRQSG